MSFLSWFDDVIPGQGARKLNEQSRQLDAQAEKDKGLTQHTDTFFGTSTPNTKDGAETKTTDAGTESHDQSGWSWLSNTYKRITGQTTTGTGIDNQTGQQTTASTTTKSSTELDPQGLSAKGGTENSSAQKTLDTGGMAATAKSQLEAKLNDPNATLSDADKAKLQADIAKLAAKDVDEATLKQVIQANQLQVPTKLKTVSADSSTTNWSTDPLAGNLGTKGKSDSSTTTDPTAGTSTTTTSSSSTSVKAGKGELNATSTQSNSNLTTDSGGKTSGTSSSSSTSGGIVSGPGGTGVKAGKSSDDTTVKNDVATKNSSAGSVTVTDKGVAASGSESTTQTSGKDTGIQTTKSAKIGADVGFSVDVAVIPGSVPPQYKVVMTLTDSINAQLAAGKKRGDKMDPNAAGTTGSVSAGATAGVSLVYTHIMDGESAKAYMANADAVTAGQQTAPVSPEFDTLSKVKALVGEGKDGGNGVLAVMGSSASSTNLKDGESVEMTLSGDVRLGGSLGKGSATAGGSAGFDSGEGGSRTIKVERAALADSNGKHMNDITVTFMHKADKKANASGTMDGVTVGAAGNESESHSQGATVRLDVDAPDYADKYAQVCGASTVEDVRKLATVFTQAQSQSSGGSGTLGVPGVAVTVGVQSGTSENTAIDKDKGRVTGQTTGQQAVSGGVTLGQGDAAAKALQSTSTTSSTTTVDSSGSETTLQQETASSSPLRAVSEGIDSLKAWWNKDKSAKDVAAAATTTPQEKLKAQLETTYSDLEQYALSKNDVTALCQRASDSDEWAHCCNTLRVWDQWKAFGSRLANPPVKADEAAVNGEDALALARGRVMSQFIADQGSEGMEFIVNALRHWKQRGGALADTDLGTHLDWPNSLLGAKSKYDQAHTRARMATDYLQRLVGKPDAYSQGQAWYQDTAAMLESARGLISANNDIPHPAAKLEMLDAVNQTKSQLDSAWQMTEGTLKVNAPVSASVAAPAPASAQMSSATQTQSVDPNAGQQQTPEQLATAASWRRISELTQLLAGYKAQEQVQFNRARAVLPQKMGGNLNDDAFMTVFRTDWDASFEILHEVGADLQKSWIAHVVELRGVYGQIKLEPEKWIVSAGPSTPRSAQYEPDMDTLYRLFVQADDSAAHQNAMQGIRQTANAWRDRFTTY